MKKLLLLVLILMLNISLFACTSGGKGTQLQKEDQYKEEPQQVIKSDAEVNPIVYKNTQYGFTFSLPESWKDYKIVADKWEGLAIDNSQGEKVTETGPMISIRHPQWTLEKPRQDIPIMIFTLAQWDMLQQDKFHIGAAPIGPSEFGRNSQYVFALPARYNYAFPTGFEEVESILKSNPLHPIPEQQ